ncbi:MAG: LysM-like peptidoglycan-binding domain-containing protein [Gammaproteobacteria bacterium]|nr:LysM-like peptidoglycan-binding domain-containing protein [Gammaproteobacteria bacterium]
MMPNRDPGPRIRPSRITATDLDTDWQTVSVKSGDSMALIFKRLGLSPRQLYEIMQLGEVTQALKKLRPGQELLFDIDDSGEQTMLKALQYDPDSLHQLTVQRTDDGYEAELAEAELTTRVRAASATIDSSLFLAGQAVGMSDNLIMQLVAIYGWDIDFVLDIRKGDQFSVIFEETYRDGAKIKDGPIIAAEFINQDRTIRAVRYVHPDGKIEYYAENGDNMRKAFIRTPLDVLPYQFTLQSQPQTPGTEPYPRRIRAPTTRRPRVHRLKPPAMAVLYISVARAVMAIPSSSGMAAATAPSMRTCPAMPAACARAAASSRGRSSATSAARGSPPARICHYEFRVDVMPT